MKKFGSTDPYVPYIAHGPRLINDKERKKRP